MNTDPDLQQIFGAFAELRELNDDGPRSRKLLDRMFRGVHSLKAKAAASGLKELAAAAHEVENVLHSLRTGKIGEASDARVSDGISAEIWDGLKQDEKHALTQALAEGLRLFLVETSFDVADFDRHFQYLKENLSKTGEVISISPTVDNEQPGKVNFRILYAAGVTSLPVSTIPDVTMEEIVGISRRDAPELKTDLAALEPCFEKLSAQIVNLRMPPVENAVELILLAGRASVRATGKEVDFDVGGEEILNDPTLAEVIMNPLIHLIRNAVAHGIESGEERAKLGKPARGKIVIEATQFEGKTTITITDDGRGIDPALIDEGLLFRPGFSTASEVSETSGRGVGLDVVQTTVQQLSGSVRVKSSLGEGSTFEISLPHS